MSSCKSVAIRLRIRSIATARAMRERCRISSCKKIDHRAQSDEPPAMPEWRENDQVHDGGQWAAPAVRIDCPHSESI